MTIYRSKIGLGLVIPVIAIQAVVIVTAILHKDWWVLLGLTGIAAFVIHLFSTTYYQVDESVLKIRSGFLYNKSLPISSISKIEETFNPLSAPAISLDRLEVVYNGSDSVLISPKDKNGFITHLLKLNPSIALTLRK